MASKAFDAITAGLEDGIAYAKEDTSRGAAGAYPAGDLDVAAVRRKTGLSQAKFANTFGVSKATLMRWQQGRAAADRSGPVLLRVIDRNPGAVMEAVAG